MLRFKELGLYKDTAQVKSAPATPVKSVASTPTGRKSRESTIAPAGNNPKKRRMEAFDDTSAVESSSPAAFASSIPSNPPTPPVDQTIPKKWRDSGLRKMVCDPNSYHIYRGLINHGIPTDTRAR